MRLPRLPQRVRRVLKYTVGVTTVGVAGFGFYLNTNEGFNRQFQFYKASFPILLHYKTCEYTHNIRSNLSHSYRYKFPTMDDKYESLHKLYANEVLNVILKLRGLYVKAGQFMTSRPDIVPLCWIEKLRSLQDGLPPKDMDYIQKVIETEISLLSPSVLSQYRQHSTPDKPISIWDIFCEFDPKALGAASIGQAHLATLNNATKDRVCVKIQYPEMEKMFRSDLAAIRTFVSFLEPAIGDALYEMEGQFLKEFDYRLECDNLKTARKNTLPFFGDVVDIPKPFSELTTRNLLVMSYLPGQKLEIAIQDKLRQFLSIKLGRIVTEDEIPSDKLLTEIRYALMKHNLGSTSSPSSTETTSSDAAVVPSLTQLSVKLDTVANMKYMRMVMRIRQLIYNCLARLFNVTSLFLFWPLTFGYESAPQMKLDLPIVPNPEKFLQTLFQVHGRQIFIDGAFNGDPHPGNLVLKPDGKLGLIDYGQFKYLSRLQRKDLSQLIIALADRDRKAIVEKAIEMGFRSKKMNEYYIEKWTVLGFDRLDDEFREGKSTIEFFTKLQSMDEPIKIPGDFYIVNRTVFLLRGLSQLLQYDVSVAQQWRPFAQQFLDDYNSCNDIDTNHDYIDSN